MRSTGKIRAFFHKDSYIFLKLGFTLFAMLQKEIKFNRLNGCAHIQYKGPKRAYRPVYPFRKKKEKVCHLSPVIYVLNLFSNFADA